MATKLTKKRRGFVKDYLATGIGVLAVKNNFDVVKDTTAGVIASQLLNDPKIKDAINEALTDELLASKHLALLNKMQGDEIDVQAVSKGLDLAYKIKGTYAPEKKVSATIDLTPTPNKDTEDLAKQYEEALKLKILNGTPRTNINTPMDSKESN